MRVNIWISYRHLLAGADSGKILSLAHCFWGGLHNDLSLWFGSQFLAHDSFYAHPDYPVDSYLSWTGIGSCSDEWGKGLVCTQERIRTSSYRLVRMEVLSLVTVIPGQKLFVPVLPGCLEKAPKILRFFFLTYNFLFCTSNPFQSEFLPKSKLCVYKADSRL